MKKTSLLLIASILSLGGFAPKGITFKVEELSKPEDFLRMSAPNEIYKRLILSDLNLTKFDIEKNRLDVPYHIIAQSKSPSKLVDMGYHAFFSGMYDAYENHRHFVLSPDMIWLLISQGFARHVNANAEQLRHHFVDFAGKTTLVVATETIALDNPNSPWEEIFPEFTAQIARHTGKELMDILTCNFSTTTPIERVASQITIMEAMKSYFEFVVFFAVCGIPEITLQGTTQDWKEVLNKAKKLSRYDLQWWTSELVPVLEEFVKASQGEINKPFWRAMFKHHSQEKYGAPNIIDGWIVKFFPYDKNGKRNNLQELRGGRNLPEEIVKVDLKYIDTTTGVTTLLELWSGFIGLEQNMKDYTLTPRIGWMIRKKDIENDGLTQKFRADSKRGEIHIRVKEIPAALFRVEMVKKLSIDFIDKIIIPDELTNVQIEFLELTGTITTEETTRIKELFPKTRLVINRKVINDIPVRISGFTTITE